MASKLEKAAEIYRSLGYEETDFDDILNLGRAKRGKRRIKIRRLDRDKTIIR